MFARKPRVRKMENYDAIIVGAGPAGSSCACLLSQQGVKVLLLDKANFPRDKVCGDAIGGKALSVLERLGATEELRQKKERRRISFSAGPVTG